MEDAVQQQPAVQAPAAPEEAGKLFHLPLFRPGVQVRYGQDQYTVSHIIVRRFEMKVYLNGREVPVDPEDLDTEPSVFTTARMPEVRRR